MKRNSGNPASFSKTIEEELLRLRKKLWKMRGRRSRITGAAFLILSGFFLLFAYVTRYVVFEVISILTLLLGVVFALIGVESYVKTDVANRAVVSVLVLLASFLSYLNTKGRAIHIPPTSEQRSGRIFLSKQEGAALPAFEEITKEASIVILNEGILLPSVGNALLQLYEEELGDLRKLDMEYLIMWLPRVLVSGLQIAEKAEMTQKVDDIHLKMTNLAFRNVCQHPTAKVVCDVTGCPVCSSIAEAVSKNTGRIVYYLKCENDWVNRETNVFYRLGPTPEKFRQREKVNEASGNEG